MALIRMEVRRVLMVAVFALAMASGLRASDDPIDRESLRSLDGVRVAVEDVPVNAPKDLDKDSLVKFVEAHLEAIGVCSFDLPRYVAHDLLYLLDSIRAQRQGW